MARRRNDQPFHITKIRQLPCEDVGEVYNAVIRRVLNARAALAGRLERQPNKGEQVGESKCLT